MRVVGTPKVVTAQVLLGFTGGAHCVRLLGAELKLLTGERERLRVVGTPKVVTAQRD